MRYRLRAKAKGFTLQVEDGDDVLFKVPVSSLEAGQALISKARAEGVNSIRPKKWFGK